MKTHDLVLTAITHAHTDVTFGANPDLVLLEFEGESHLASRFVVHAAERDAWKRVLPIGEAGSDVIGLPVLL